MDIPPISEAQVICIPADDSHKTIETAASVWDALQKGGATRHSCMINLGGGMVTDLGGFAASTFKRGMHFINIPTTLLSMVDAAFGGKTGVNFGGLKNEIGVFRKANDVIVDTRFLKTLDQKNLLSGYAEMLKHALLSDIATWSEHVCFSPEDILQSADALSQLQKLVEKSIEVKDGIVKKDPLEQGLRKALNLGHTFGHAIESFSLNHDQQPMLHGYAVAFGLICELYLSATLLHFPTDRLRQTTAYINEHYGTVGITCKHYDELISYMLHDKKNRSGKILCTLLADIGDIRIDQELKEENIKEAFDFLREG